MKRTINKYKQPISRNGIRLYPGDIIKVLKGCGCDVCTPLKEGLATVAATQDEDRLLHANECKGGEEPLLRLRIPSSGGRTGCCFTACNVDFVYREAAENSIVNISINVVNKPSVLLSKKDGESSAGFGARIADTIDLML